MYDVIQATGGVEMMRKRLAVILTITMMAVSVLGGCSKKEEAAVPAAEPIEETVAEDDSEETEQAAEAQEITPPSEDITILYTNDVHCGIEDFIGYAGLAAYKKNLVEQGKQVLLVDAGDIIQGAAIGSLSKGEYPIEIMNQVGYDVATMGNHEFDYGMDRFFELKDMAKFPFVSCNFMDLEKNERVFDAYQMFEFGETQVAFVGITTPKTITSSTPKYFQDDAGNFIYGFCQDESGQGLYDAVQTAVDEARAAGADYVIGLAHLGIVDSTTPWMSTEVIADTTGMDAMIDGHSHTVMEEEHVKNLEGKDVILTQTGTKLEQVGEMVINTEGKISSGLTAEFEEKDSDTEAYIQTIMEQFGEQLSEVIGQSEVDLVVEDPATGVRIVRTAETNLGDLCADAYRAAGEADVAMVNGGGVRAAIEAGEITYEDVLNVQPFGNAICVVEATGQQILDALELGVSAMPEESGGFMQVSGMTYEIDMNVPSSVTLDADGMFVSVDGEYRVKNVKVAGEDLDLSKTYTLASHNYMLLNGGDGFNMFAGDTVLKDSIILDVDAVMTYIRDTMDGTVKEDEAYADPYGEGRIMAIE